MANNYRLKPIAAALGATFAVTLAVAPLAGAAENPFSMTEFESGYMVAEGAGEGKCGEGKCGGDKKEAEGKCGGDKKDAEGKCGGDKKGAEGKCGGDKTDAECK